MREEEEEDEVCLLPSFAARNEKEANGTWWNKCGERFSTFLHNS